jgi:hypothetical protein
MNKSPVALPLQPLTKKNRKPMHGFSASLHLHASVLGAVFIA